MAERFELEAMMADDALLDLLAAGDAAALGGLPEVENDPAIQLLAELRLAVELAPEISGRSIEMADDAESFLALCAAAGPVPDPFARRVATRSLALGVAAVAALSVSGVAAAVTGDPLAPYEKVIEKVVDELTPRTSFPVNRLDGVVGSKKQVATVVRQMKEDKARRSATSTTDPTVPAAYKDVLVAKVPLDRNRPPLLPKPPPTVQDTGGDDDQGQPQETQEPRPEPTTDPTQPPATTQPTQPPTTTQPTQPPTTTTQPTQPPVTTQPTSPPTTQLTQPPVTTQPTPPDQTTAGDKPGDQSTTAGGFQEQGETGGQATVTPTQPPTQPPLSPADEPPPADEPSPDAPEGAAEQWAHGEDPPGAPDSPFSSELIRGILAMLNSVMTPTRG